MTLPTSSTRVLAAISATPRSYFEKCLAMRAAASPQRCGSFFEGSPQDVEATLLSASWEPYDHPEVAPGCQAFRAPIPGTLGIVPLEYLRNNMPVTLADPKGTGFVEVEVDRALVADLPAIKTDFTTLIVGSDDGVEVVFTFHPGAPIKPSDLLRDALGSSFTGSISTIAGKALALGFKYAKLRG